MGKKEASKGREWEKGRRDVLNQTFWELHRALPNYVEGQTISKKTILIEALACIHQLRNERQQGDVRGSQLSESTVLQKWVQHVLEKFSQLLSFLNSSNLKAPADCLSLEAPPSCINPDISKLVMRIGKSSTENSSETQRIVVNKKHKTGGKRKANPVNGTSLALSHNETITSPEKEEPFNGVKETQCQDLKSDFKSNLITNPSTIQSNPLVVSPPLQMRSQLLFASNSSSTPLSTTLPLLVSVTGVKTVNPFILVQSNVMATNPPSTRKVVCSVSGINTRPIQPGPPNKLSKKLKKMPIPSLKLKAGFSHVLPHCGAKKQRSVSKMSDSLNDVRATQKKKKNNAKLLLKSDLVKGTSTFNGNSLKASSVNKNTAKDNLNLSEKQPANITSSTEEKSSKISDVNKENEAENGVDSKLDGSKAGTFLSPTVKDAATIPELLENLEHELEENVEAEANSILNVVETQLQNAEKSTKRTIDLGNNASMKKRLCEVDINTEIVKRLKCSAKSCTAEELKPIEDTTPNCENNCGSSVEGSSPVKPSKSNYSILAICAEHQLLQRTDVTSQAPEEIVQGIHHEGSLEQNSSKQLSVECRMEITAHDRISIEKPNDICCSSGKSKDAASTLPDHYSGWSDKSKFKSDRICPNGNLFSNIPLHNNKNTFIPISDIDNFKAVPDSFDASDGSFGLPMHPSDISNDIFASLQVPSGGQHPESISPTAAFLSAFPLVSTSKATELLSDDAVCENNDSQPGIKTILQIGNLDCDTPVTKCVSEFSSIEGNNVGFSSSSLFNHSTVPLTMTKNKPLESTVGVRNFVQKDLDENLSHKCSGNRTMLPLKESSNFVHKNSESTSSLKGNPSLISKNIYQPSCSNSSKQNCHSRSEPISTISSHLNNQLHDSRVQGKPSGTDLPESILDKTPLKLNESTFLVCEKQSDWMDMHHSSHGSYPDFLTSSAPRSDCAVNYILPSVLMSSSTGGEEPLAASKSQASSSSSGILSWSTTPLSENVQPPKQAPRLGHFQDMFAPLKSSNRSVDMQQLMPNHSVATSESSLSQLTSGSVPGPLVSNKLNSVASNYNQNHHIVKPSDHGLSNDKQNASSNNFVMSGNLKKSFSVSERKQLECSSSEVIKVSSSSSENGLFTQQQPNSRQETSTSTPMVYPQSETKQVKANNIYFDDRTSSQNIKSGMNSELEGHNSKQSINLLNYNHSSVVPELKQSSAVSSYNHESNLSIKENEMVPYHLQTNVPKQHSTPSSHYTSGDLGSSGPKKHVIHYNIVSESSVDVSKHAASGNFNLESTSTMMHFGSSSANSVPTHPEPYNNKSNGHAAQLVKPQSSQVRQQCGRSSNKEAVANLHRPPVNWMTAPDIRSHQHHSGPSFGNNSNMNSTQGLLYLSDHTKDAESCATVYDQSSNFHCLDITHSGQPLFKGNELHLFGNESMENFHDSSAWSPNKNGGSSMLGNMMIPSTLPTLVGDLALGDNNISRPFLPSYGNDTQSCHKKSVKRSLNASRRVEKVVEETGVAAGQECAGSFLSVSQLVNPGGASKNRASSATKESNISYPESCSSHDAAVCQSTKPNLSKTVSSNYSTEALLSSSNVEQITQLNHRKRRSHGAHYSNNYVGGGVSYQNCGSVTLQAQGPQTQFLTDLPPHRTNDYQGTFLHSDGVPSFMLSNSSRAHRNHSYTLQNISDRSPTDDNSHTQRTQHSGGMAENNAVRHTRTSINNSVNNASTSATVSSSSTIMDFGYINMPPAVSQDDISLTNHHPAPHPPSFLPHHSYTIPMSSQDTLYTAPRLSMHPTATTPHSHPSQNNTIQSPSATTLTNFHLSTIFPEINGKVIC